MLSLLLQKKNLHPQVTMAITWQYNVGDRMFVLLTDNQQFEQTLDGYRIHRRILRQGRPAYQLAGAFFPHRLTNIFWETELLPLHDFNELTSPWSPFQQQQPSPDILPNDLSNFFILSNI